MISDIKQKGMEYLLIIVEKKANKTKKTTTTGKMKQRKWEKKHIFLWDICIEI